MSFPFLLNEVGAYINKKSNILETHRQLIIDIVKPALHIEYLQNETQSSESVQSKIGGKPLVSNEMSELLKKDSDWVFIFQLDFSNFNIYSDLLNLPSEGMISVFMKAYLVTDKYYLNPLEYKCFFAQDLVHVDKDYNSKVSIKENEMIFKEWLSIPDDEDPFWEPIEDENDDFGYDVYEHMQDAIASICNIHDYNSSHVGGYDAAVQSSVLYDFAGRDLIDLPVTQKEYWEQFQVRWQEIKMLSKTYVLLCQIDTLNSISNFANYLDGFIYIGIKKEDLKNRNFFRLKLVVQNT